MSNISAEDQFLDRLTRIKKFSTEGQKALHKPVLLLYALSELKHRHAESIRYSAAEKVVGPILEKFSSSKSRPRTADPFTRLEGDGIWNIRSTDRNGMFDAGGNGKPNVLREKNVEAGFDQTSLALFRANPKLIDKSIDVIAARHIPADIRDQILRMIGLLR
jgi:putative restriction endonuclease